MLFLLRQKIVDKMSWFLSCSRLFAKNIRLFGNRGEYKLSHLVPEHLLFGHLVQPLDVRDDDGHDQVDHDDGPHDNHGYQQQHCKESGQGRLGLGAAVPQIIKFKLSKDHDKAFHK